MNRRRKTHRSLTDSRIYPKRRRFYLFAAEPLVSPKTGKASKWHSLCPIEDGEPRARELAREILEHNRRQGDEGDLPGRLRDYIAGLVKKREAQAPRDKARLKMHERATGELRRQGEAIAAAFHEFDVASVVPADVAGFLDQWEGRRMAQIYRARLSDFFRWCCRKGYRADNPCREVETEPPAKRQVYITDGQYHAIRDALATGKDRRATSSGVMVQCYVDLCFLLYQRTTEIRLLRVDQISEAGIHFKPTKTERSSGASVLVPMSAEVRAVLERAKKAREIGSLYVISTRRGQPYSTTGLASAWSRACERAGLSGLTLKDLRAKALTDAKRAGYQTSQLKVAAAHTDESTTESYIRARETPTSEVVLRLPARPKN